MFNIIKAGVQPAKAVEILRDTCPNCGAIYEFGLEDLISLDRDVDGYAVWECPCCKIKRTAKRSKIWNRTEYVKIEEKSEEPAKEEHPLGEAHASR